MNYDPTLLTQLNSAEKAIAVMKIREEWIASKKLSMNLLRKFVDSISPKYVIDE